MQNQNFPTTSVLMDIGYQLIRGLINRQNSSSMYVQQAQGQGQEPVSMYVRPQQQPQQQQQPQAQQQAQQQSQPPQQVYPHLQPIPIYRQPPPQQSGQEIARTILQAFATDNNDSFSISPGIRSEQKDLKEQKEHKELKDEKKTVLVQEMDPLQCDPLCREVDDNSKICLLYLGQNRKFQLVVLSKHYGTLGWIYDSSNDRDGCALQTVLPLFFAETGTTNTLMRFESTSDGQLVYHIDLGDSRYNIPLARMEAALALGFRSIYTENYAPMMRETMRAHYRDERKHGENKAAPGTDADVDGDEEEEEEEKNPLSQLTQELNILGRMMSNESENENQNSTQHQPPTPPATTTTATSTERKSSGKSVSVD